MNTVNQSVGKHYALYHGDSCEVLQSIPDESIHFSVFSPPFASLYAYSNSDRDLGNCKSDDEFYTHFGFIIAQLYRTMMPGRNVSIHCMDIPAMKERDGYIGLKDFPAKLRSLFEHAGFIYHGKTIIWKDPLIEATRTKALGLMHKQLCKDSAICRSGLPDYLLTMRKPGVNREPVTHESGLDDYVGTNPPRGGVLSHEIWRKYASPIWMDINQSNTLQKKSARDSNDERHICPLQLDVIERAIQLWTNEGDTVLTPFAGIGSEVYVALKTGRRGIGIELKESYYRQAVKNCESVDAGRGQQELF